MAAELTFYLLTAWIKLWYGHYPSFLFADVIKQCGQSQLCGEKGLIQLVCMLFSISLREIREALKQKLEAQTMEKCCMPAQPLLSLLPYTEYIYIFYYMCALCLWKLEEGSGFLGTGGTDG